MRDVSPSTEGAIVVASPDARVRTRCVAQLAQRSEMVVSAADFVMPTVADRFRGTATIAIAEALLPADTSQWRDIIEDHGWRGRVLILGAPGSTVDPATIDFVYLPDPLSIAALVASV